MKFKRLLTVLLIAGAFQSGSLFSVDEDIVTHYKKKTHKAVDAKTGKAKTTVKSKTAKAKTTPHKPKITTTKAAQAKATTKKYTPKKAALSKDVKTSTTAKSVKHDLNPNKKTPAKKTEHLRDPKTGRFETEAQAHPHDPKTGRFTSSRAAASRATTGRSALGSAALGSAAAAGVAGKSSAKKLTDKQKEARVAELARDRQVAQDNMDWKRSKNIKQYSRYDKLKHDTKDIRKQYGWRWLKAPWSKGTGKNASYAFWNGQCGWMYYDLDKKEWWHPCTGRWAKEPQFETGSKTKK